ncbi:MAG: ADP-ribosylglycohydrolase family protein [Bradymonadia bacterium]
MHTTHNAPQLTLGDRLQGALWGLLLGDATGVPYEFHGPRQIPPFHEIELTPPVLFQRAHIGVPVGTWSDDGAHALALLDSLLECGGLDLYDLGQRLVEWYREGRYAVDRRVFDIGVQTSRALNRLEQGVDPEQAGPNGEWDNGNGALMRVMPLALWHTGTDEALVADAHRQSLVTHGHLRSQICCAWYCLWARMELAGHAGSAQQALERLRMIYDAHWPAHRAELEDKLRPDAPEGPNGSGYVVDCLYSAIYATTAEDVRGVIRKAIALGNDTDTTACVAAGIAGARWGYSGLPQDWLRMLRGQALVQPLSDGLVARREAHLDDAWTYHPTVN